MAQWYETAFDETHREQYFTGTCRLCAGYCIQVSAGTAALLGIVSEAELGPRGH